MLYIPPPIGATAVLWFVVMFLIISGARKRLDRRRFMILVLIITMGLAPLQSWVVYDVYGMYQGDALDNERFIPLLLGPQETYKSEILSNLHVIVPLAVSIRTYNGILIVDLQDENQPESSYAAGNFSDDYFSLILPYTYTALFQVARWTLNLYNPSDNLTVDMILTYGYPAWEDSPDIYFINALFWYIQPTLGLVALCSTVYWNRKRMISSSETTSMPSLKTEAANKDDEFDSVEDKGESEKYQGLRNRRK